MTVSGNTVTAPLSTAVPAPASTTQAAAYTSFEVYNNDEIELVSIAKGATKFLSTLIALGRQKNGGQWNDIGLTEMMSTNFPEFKFYEEDIQKEYYDANSTIANTATTTIVFVTTTGLIAGNVIENVATGEQMRISSVTNGTDVVVKRAQGTIAAAAITSGDKFLVVSTAIGAGVASVDTIGVAAQNRSNYFQKFVTTISTDDFNNMSHKIKDKNSMDKFMKDKAITHYREIEKAVLFGQKFSGTDENGKAYYKMDGVIQSAKRGWTHDISSTLTRATLEEALSYPLRYTNNGSAKKIALCGTKVRPALSNLFESRLQVGQIADIDLTFSSLTLNTGEYMFIDHPFLDENSGYDKHIIIVDPAFTKVVYPQGRDLNDAGFNGKTRFVYNAANSTYAEQKGDYVTYMSMMNANSNAGGLIRVVA